MAKDEEEQVELSPVNPVGEAIKDFNKWHGSEATARMVGERKGKVIVEMGGSFCRTCGVYDYIDDLKIEIEKKLNKSMSIALIEEREDGFLITLEAA